MIRTEDRKTQGKQLVERGLGIGIFDQGTESIAGSNSLSLRDV
jgi:hypothetical protein